MTVCTSSVPAVVAEIDSSALRHNLRRVRESAPGCPVAAVIKADGYGHGLIRVARALQGVDAYAVARLEEALWLREEGITGPILLLEGFLHAAELEPIARHRLTVVVHHRWQLEALEGARLPLPVQAWLKLDSGMHRLGFPPSELPAARARLAACASVTGPLVLMTHLACADDRDSPVTLRQLSLFDRFTAEADGQSIANSAAILGWPAAQRGWLRPGIMLYGASPFTEGSGESLGLRPVMTLRSRLVAINRLREGDPVGYGGDWICPEDMPVGVVAIGYGDGYPRHAPAGTPVLIGGRQVALVGRVSMDMITVDLRSLPHARVGDTAILWGRGLPVETVARCAGTIAYELLCGVARHRVHYQEIQHGQVL